MKIAKLVVLIVAVVALAGVLTGCGTTMTAPGAGIGGLEAQPLKCDGSYTILDTVSASGERKVLFGFIPLGGESTYGAVNSGGMGSMFGPKHDAIAIATYNALGKAKGADTILPLTTTITVSGFPPIYTVEEATVTCKALKINAK